MESMATPSTTKKNGAHKPSVNNDLALVWLDDTAGQDPNIKAMFLTLFEQVFIFTNATACIELVESAENEEPCIFLLVSGKYGQMLVPDRFQPLKQVKDIYVYCFDIAKHNQWAQKCDKVRCVDSDFNKILKCLKHDVQKTGKQTSQTADEQPDETEADQGEEELLAEGLERFTADNNLYNQLAVDLLLQDAAAADGVDDFKIYCETYKEEGESQLKAFKPEDSLKDWYKENLVFVKLNVTDFTQLWALRWFLRILNQQLTNEHEQLTKNSTIITMNYGIWLSTDELDVMKQRVGQMITSTELLLTYDTRNKALNSIKNKQDEQRKHKTVFEITVDTTIRATVPYGEVQNDQILVWFGSRYQLTKIEWVKPKDDEPFWLIGLDLSSTLDDNTSMEGLYNYYRKELTDLNDPHYALGQLLMYKGLYCQAEKWLQTNNHWKELAELALRQYQIERANTYLEQASLDSDDVNLLRAYANLLISSENAPKGRTILIRICSEASDRTVRARASIALGFINLIISQQMDQAFDYFRLGNEALSKTLPEIHPDIAKSLIGMGYVYLAQKNKDEAQKAFEKALEIQKQSLPADHPDIAKSRNGLAHCLAEDKRTIKQALKEFNQAFKILIRTFPREYKTHPEILLTKIDCEKLHKGKELRVRNTLLDYI